MDAEFPLAPVATFLKKSLSVRVPGAPAGFASQLNLSHA